MPNITTNQAITYTYTAFNNVWFFVCFFFQFRGKSCGNRVIFSDRGTVGLNKISVRIVKITKLTAIQTEISFYCV